MIQGGRWGQAEGMPSPPEILSWVTFWAQGFFKNYPGDSSVKPLRQPTK